MTIGIETEHLRYEIGADGANVAFIDRRTGADWCAHDCMTACASVRIGKATYPATAATAEGDVIRLGFGGSGVRAAVRVTRRPRHLVWEVVSLDGEGVDEFVFADIPLALTGAPEEPFAACALALNLRTNVAELPQPMGLLRAACYCRFGSVGAKVALIGCPREDLRAVMQEVVREADELPRSSIGGAWALDEPRSRGSYLFNFGDLTLDTVDAWIDLARRLGFTQIDFHGGGSFRFGDCRPNPALYPDGFPSLKAVIDRLHAAGIQAGLHTYAFFIDKSCPWVTPVPDPRLGKDAAFTLAAAVGPVDETIRVVEPTTGMSAVTGFFVRNSATLHVGNELVTYRSVGSEPPYAFEGCRRGAYGTTPAVHASGARVGHLKECFGLFTPDGNSSLLAELAASAAEAFNTCGFDMIYLDALDGEDILGGAENGWHYGSKFVFELWRRLARPALMEMSTFHHHLWHVRSRMGAWDHPTRSHKRYIDIHVAANDAYRRMFLPTNLGWWAVKTWTGPQGEPTFADDIEYLCAKALGTDAGLSLMGVDPKALAERPALARLAEVIRRWEELRRSGTVSPAVRDWLRAPGREFTLAGDPPRILPARYARRTVELAGGEPATWTVENLFAAQRPRIRIEALAAGAPDDPAAVTVIGADVLDRFTERDAAPGMRATLDRAAERTPDGAPSFRYAATNDRPAGSSSARDGSWTRIGARFSPSLDLKGREALALWVRGDGRGEVLNVQLRCPRHVIAGVGDRYVVIDFIGWRHVVLVEVEGERVDEYAWPYSGDTYGIYREGIEHGEIEWMNLWYNAVPPGETVSCLLGPIRALPLRDGTLARPAISVGGVTIAFPTEVRTGSYLEYASDARCILYGPDGSVLGRVAPDGEAPLLATGANDVAFSSQGRPARARVIVGTVGDPIT